ncbi:MAG: UDP-N-acetylenolpyruvoylglucosamine reductase [Parcubacteria group bacterium GW2011_GWB1_57_6]|nr:MAG: UDP-N-acetylenolpyruvoylglucosamine reductase [Parcubacteria group bacterium GW2011_GWB1_57_6]
MFGIENLAGIPGTVGGATVQNIGAYGAELADVFEYADTIDRTTGVHARIGKKDAALAYRTSFFKNNRNCIITAVALRFSSAGAPNISYPDLARARSAGEPLAAPADIARAVRAIRAKKFPRNDAEGTAGSFFKNPVVSRELADSLRARFPDLPTFPQEDGRVKLALAWLLDHALSLKGYAGGPVRLYEKQPLVVVARAGARAHDVEALARHIAERVQKELGIGIEREVELFG